MSAELALQLASGIAWTVVYIDCIVIGFGQRTYAMPVFALTLNIAWELIYSLNGLIGPENPSVQTGVNIAWLCCDAVMVFTFVKFGRRQLPRLAADRFALFSTLIFATGLAAQLAFHLRFDWLAAAQYSAFAQNALMSVLFVALYAYRRGPAGQSMVIAVAKWIGTLAPTIQHGFLYGVNEYVLLMGALCFVWDVVYMVLLARGMRERRAVTFEKGKAA